MPRVRVLAGIAGEGRNPGDILDLPANEAQELIRQERAELVRSSPVETPERTPIERAAPKSGAKRRGARSNNERPVSG